MKSHRPFAGPPRAQKPCHSCSLSSPGPSSSQRGPPPHAHLQPHPLPVVALGLGVCGELLSLRSRKKEVGEQRLMQSPWAPPGAASSASAGSQGGTQGSEQGQSGTGHPARLLPWAASSEQPVPRPLPPGSRPLALRRPTFSSGPFPPVYRTDLSQSWERLGMGV